MMSNLLYNHIWFWLDLTFPNEDQMSPSSPANLSCVEPRPVCGTPMHYLIPTGVLHPSRLYEGYLWHHSGRDDLPCGDVASGGQKKGQGSNGVKLILSCSEWPPFGQRSQAAEEYKGQPLGTDTWGQRLCHWALLKQWGGLEATASWLYMYMC